MLAITISILVGCNDEKTTTTSHTEPSQTEFFELPVLNIAPSVRGHLFSSKYTLNNAVILTDATGSTHTTQSHPNSSFRLDDLSSSALDHLKLHTRFCLDTALTQCLTLTHQLSGKYTGEILPLDLRTTLIDLLVKNHQLHADIAQAKVNDYFNLDYKISKLTLIPEQYLDQEKILEDFAETALKNQTTLDQYLLQLAAKIATQPELRHEKRVSTMFKPKLNGKQLIEETIQHANDPSLLTLLSTPQVQNTSQLQAKINERLRYFNATVDSMLDLDVRINDLQDAITPTVQELEKKYEISLIQQNPAQFKEFVTLTKGVIFDLNQLHYLTNIEDRQREIQRIETVLEHLMFKRDEIHLNLQSTYQNQIALNMVLAKEIGISEKNLKQISEYIAYYINYYDHINALSYYLLAEELKYHAATLAPCTTPQTTGITALPLNTTIDYCGLYQHYLTQRNQYFSSALPPLQLQSGTNSSTTISAIDVSAISNMDLETALLAVQTQRAHLLEEQLKSQIASTQEKNNKIARLHTLLALSKRILAALPLPTDAEYQTKLATLTEKFQSEWTNAEKAFCSTALCYFNKSIAQSNKQDWEKLIQSTQSQIDSLSNTQSMDMLRLQSLSNKRNEAFDVMTNFVKKMQDSRSSIIGNMR